MAKKQAHVTPAMIVRYSYLTVPSTEYREGGMWSVKVAIEDETPEAEYLKELIENLTEKYLDKATSDLKPAQRKKVIVTSPLMAEEDPETGEDTGWLVMNFKLPHKVTRKSDGQEFEFTPNLYDGSGNFIAVEDRSAFYIGSGSKVRISFLADRCYVMEAQGENGKFYRAGLKTELKAVKILELIEGGGDDGFGNDDEGSFSFTKPATPKQEDDFGSVKSNDDDGDF